LHPWIKENLLKSPADSERQHNEVLYYGASDLFSRNAKQTLRIKEIKKGDLFLLQKT
jgi:hypothetical protein